jgi:hypothetical protein
VTPAEWSNVKYTLNEQTKEVAEELLGTFTQYPLKLAWAITIHKSQGLTFERAIIDAQAAFAHGQVYVALSRCKSFEGIVLRSKIAFSSVKTDSTVKTFYSEEAEKNAPDESETGTVENCLSAVALEHESALHADAYRQFQALHDQTTAQIFDLADKFVPQLRGYFQQGGQPEQNEELQARIGKACAWFAEKLGGTLLPAARSIQILTDNKAVRKSALDALSNLEKEFFAKNACMAAAQTGFAAQTYLRTRANADLDFQAAAQHTPAVPAGGVSTPQDTAHPALFALLVKWRADYAERYGLEAYEVLLTKTLLEVVQRLPVITSDLQKVRGIGKVKSKQFGAEMLAIVRDYCIARNLQTDALALPDPDAPKPPKPDSKVVTLDLFRAGKTIDEIAAERGFARTTIEGHLAHFVGLGELDILDFMDAGAVAQIDGFFREHNTRLSSDAKTHFGEAYSYGQIKMVLELMRQEEAGE